MVSQAQFTQYQINSHKITLSQDQLIFIQKRYFQNVR